MTFKTNKTKIQNLIKDMRREDGNALFLILIAVALFAGLSYAVTQSGRSSGQSVSDESNMILSSQVMQYPAGIRTGITRMLIRGVSIDDLKFAPPASYGTPVAEEVFHPSGGGVAHQAVIQDTVDDPDTDLWVFHDDVVVTNIATSSAEVVAVLPDVRGGVCQQINEAATGERSIPVLAGVTAAQMLAGGVTITGAATTPVIDGQPFLCIETSDGANFYYHVLVEQ